MFKDRRDMSQAEKEERLRQEVQRKLVEDDTKPLKVSIMGQTGVGKSSLLNALFNVTLQTGDVRPTTKSVQRIVARGTSGHELWFYDLPGIGESREADRTYLADYRQKLEESDIVLWAIHADSRSQSFDFETLTILLAPFDTAQRGRFMSKITFVLTKADLLTSPPWILTRVKDEGIFVANPATRRLLTAKELYCQETFIAPFKDVLTARTYHDGSFTATSPSLSHDDKNVFYKGFLDETTLNQLRQRYPRQAKVFERLHDSYRVIPCSALFKFNLALLLRVIVDKLGSDAAGRFSNLYNNERLNSVPWQQAKERCNLIIIENAHGQVLFDLATTNI